MKYILHLFFPLTFNFYVTNYLLLFERNLSISGVSKIPLHKKWNSEMHKKMEFSINDFFSKCDQIHSFLWILVTFTEKSLFGKFGYCAV